MPQVTFCVKCHAMRQISYPERTILGGRASIVGICPVCGKRLVLVLPPAPTPPARERRETP